MMNRRWVRAFLVTTVLAAGLLIPNRVAQAEGERAAGICYTFPGNITVCCDASGCYIV
jgi:hypothetical protein